MKFIQYPNGDWWEWDTENMVAYNISGGHHDINENALGECHFTEQDSWHKLFVNLGYDPLVDNAKLWHTGWISPCGDFYPCEAHEADAETIYMLVYGTEHSYYGDRMIEKGWKKVTNSFMFSIYADNGEYDKFYSKEQEKTFNDWYKKYIRRNNNGHKMA